MKTYYLPKCFCPIFCVKKTCTLGTLKPLSLFLLYLYYYYALLTQKNELVDLVSDILCVIFCSFSVRPSTSTKTFWSVCFEGTQLLNYKGVKDTCELLQQKVALFHSKHTNFFFRNVTRVFFVWESYCTRWTIKKLQSV